MLGKHSVLKLMSNVACAKVKWVSFPNLLSSNNLTFLSHTNSLSRIALKKALIYSNCYKSTIESGTRQVSTLLLNELNWQFHFLTWTMSIFNTVLSCALWTYYTIVFCKTRDRKARIYLCPCKGKTTNIRYQHLLISVWGHNMFLNHDVVKWKLNNKLVKINVIIMVNLVLTNSSAYIMAGFLWKTAFLWCKMKFRRYHDFLG